MARSLYHRTSHLGSRYLEIIVCKIHLILDHAEEAGLHVFLFLRLNIGAHTIVCAADALGDIDGALGFLLDKNTTPFMI